MTKWVRRNYRNLLLAAAGGIAIGMSGYGQVAGSGAKAPTFDVVSIRPHNQDSNGMWIMFKPDGYSAGGVAVRSMIGSAYDVKTEDQISGISGPVAGARFDVEAKMDAETVEALKNLTEKEKWAQRRLMMQTMLADRFKLKVHHENKEVPIYTLVIAKGGFKLKDADPNNTYPNGIKGPDGISHSGMMMVGNGTLTGQGITMASLAGNVGGQVHRIVEDKTGLSGKYDVTLHWSKEEMLNGQQDTTGMTADSGPSIFTALQEQLGLKLESTKEPVDTIVVDHVEMPSEN